MRVLVATDAWHPQINGVVHTLREVARAAPPLGASIAFLTPEGLRSLPLPTYPGMRLAVARPRTIARRIVDLRPAAIHIATEGPIGLLVRRYCLANGLAFTTSFHTRFPDYVSARTPIPERWTWAALRWFHRAAGGVMAATPGLEAELVSRGFANVMAWPRGVDANLFRPRSGADLELPRPVFLTVARLAVEKNLEAFLALDLPGTKVVVGDGPARADLTRRFPDAVFLGARRGEELARAYAAADVFVFPSRTDTYGLVLLEALASGVPVAAFPVAGPRDVLA
ncbi:MAG TPA: glycosyltransferase family 1 protein, partial [Xanthobacteraceae bacterium]|nr:glycosyltransferase family 1 protein [Xanthobacteraceae bacterium]